MIYVILALIIIILILIIYFAVRIKLTERKYSKALETDKATILRMQKPADITPVVEEIKKSEVAREAIKNMPADSGDDVDILLDTLNGQR